MIVPSHVNVRHSTPSHATSRTEHACANQDGWEPTVVSTLMSAHTKIMHTTAVDLTRSAGTRMAALTVSVRQAISTIAQEYALVSICDIGYQYGSTGMCVGKCL